MIRLVNAVLSAWIAWKLALLLDLGLVGLAVAFFVPFLILNALADGFVGGIWNSGLWTTAFMRRLVGIAADGVLYLAVAWVLWLLFERFRPDIPIASWVSLAGQDAGLVRLLLWPFLAACVLRLFLETRRLKPPIGRLTAPVRNLVRSRFVGMGGSSRFGGLLDDWAHPWRLGQLMLGSSLYSPGWKVGRSDDRHFITIATSRSGKGRSGVIPNLLTWPGSALVIDPKGQNAAVTAAARGQGGGRVKKGMGQAVYIVDPFAELKGAGVELPTHRFNPLAEIDLAALDVVEQIRNITDALIVPNPKGVDFWDRSAATLISGVIAFVLVHTGLPPAEKNLTAVRMILKMLGNKDIREHAAGLPSPGGLAKAAMSMLETAGEDAEGDIIATALSHTDWLDSVAMVKALFASDFSLSELKARTATVYLVLPPQYLDQHGRFLRLFVNLALQAVGQGKKQRYPILMVLDEFYALGRMQLVAKAAGQLAGYGVKLWPIVQNLGQIEELYPDNWETFLGNAGMWQVFAVNDQTTARYLSERLGQHIVWRKQRVFDGQKYNEEWTPHGASFLRTSVELSRETSRDSGNQVVFVEGGDSFLLRRRPYDKTFPRSAYSPDPFESGESTLPGRVAAAREKLSAAAGARKASLKDRLIDKLDQWAAPLDAWERRWQAYLARRKQGGK